MCACCFPCFGSYFLLRAYKQRQAPSELLEVSGSAFREVRFEKSLTFDCTTTPMNAS